jgi:hypothetical protein
MANENEAFWAGMAVAIIMLASGFSMLFIETYTGFGAVVLSMGVMTMMLSLMVRVLVIQIQKWMDYNARIEETVANIISLRKAYQPEPSKPELEKSNQSSEEQVATTAAT